MVCRELSPLTPPESASPARRLPCGGVSLSDVLKTYIRFRETEPVTRAITPAWCGWRITQPSVRFLAHGKALASIWYTATGAQAETFFLARLVARLIGLLEEGVSCAGGFCLASAERERASFRRRRKRGDPSRTAFLRGNTTNANRRDRRPRVLSASAEKFSLRRRPTV
jgi:hypothetical protein